MRCTTSKNTPRAEHLGEEVQVLAVLVAVVEDRVLPHRRQQLRRQREPGVEVVVVVVRDLAAPARPRSRMALALAIASSRGEGDVLRAGDAPGAQSPRRSGAVLRVIRTWPSVSLAARLRISPNGAASSVAPPGRRPSTER